MAVRERDETGWDGLPGGLSFTDAGGEDDAPRGRWLRAAAWLLVLGILLGGGGAWGARWLGEADVRAVLASSTATYGTVLERLADAPDPAALSGIAAGAPRAADRLDGDLARLSPDRGDRRNAVAGQVEAERDVLRALGGLAGLEASPLEVWGEAHAALTDAVDREAMTRSALLVVDAEAARALPDTAATVRRVATTVGEAVVGGGAQAGADLLAELEAAARTADLRAVAERAEGRRTAVAAAGQGLGGGPDAAVLTALGDALLAVTELRAVAPADTSAWPPVRGRLQAALQVVADADGGLAAGAVRGRLPLALAAVDRLVQRAAQAHADWLPLHDAAVTAQAADSQALRQHATRVREAAGRWPAAVLAVEALAADSPPETVDAAWLAADGVRLGLVAAPPPVGLEAAHAGLLSAVEALTAPLLQARSAVPPDLQPARAALPAFAPALAAWEAALAAAESEVTSRVLPPPPDA